jgi:hypothetical protein
MSCAVPLPADLGVRAGVEVVVVWGPVEAGVRCLGGIVGCESVSCVRWRASGRYGWLWLFGVELKLRELEARCSGGRARCAYGGVGGRR